METVKIDLNSKQINALMKGKTVMIKPEQVGKGHPVEMSSAKAKHLHKAHSKGVGAKLSLSESEIEGGRINLDGIKKFLRQANKVYQKDIKPVVAPAIRKGLTSAVKTGLPVVASMINPALTPVAGVLADQFADKAVNAIGDKTGAFGIKGKGAKKKKAVLPKPVLAKREKKIAPSDDNSPFINPEHPANHPLYEKDQSLAVTINGGSFRAVGERVGRGLPAYGSPMNPLLPALDNSVVRAKK